MSNLITKDKSEIEDLLKNIQEGLKKYSISELNEALIAILNKKHDKSEEIDYVFSIVTNEFNISIRTLKQKNHRGIINDAKQIAYCLLHLTLGLSIRHIADKIFFNWHTSVSIAIKRFKTTNTEIKQDKEFIDKYTKLQLKLIEFVNTKK